MRYAVLVSATYVDTVLTVPHFPAEDDKLRACSLIKRRGGNGANTAEVLQQLLIAEGVNDVRLVLLSVLPAVDSAASRMIRSSLPGVDCSRCIYRSDSTEPASSYIIRSQATGSRTSVSHNGLIEMSVEEFENFVHTIGESACWYHFEGRIPETLSGCINHLKRQQPNARISLELENPKRTGLSELVPLVDVVFFSRTWAQAHGYISARAFLEHTQSTLTTSQSLPLLFCTWGAEGADALACNGTARVHVDALDVDPRLVVDTVGAGDTFIAGVLLSLLSRQDNQLDLAKALTFATHLACRKVQREGFDLSLPTREH